MNKILYIFLILITVTNCTPKEVVKHHGVPFLEKKQNSLVVNESNKNDIRKILGSPSTTSKFDNDVWIYIERKQTQSELKNLGQMKIFKNDVLVLNIDSNGILRKKELFNLEDMENIEIAKEITSSVYKNESFIYSFFTTLRQKINDPTGVRAKKREKINQR